MLLNFFFPFFFKDSKSLIVVVFNVMFGKPIMILLQFLWQLFLNLISNEMDCGLISNEIDCGLISNEIDCGLIFNEIDCGYQYFHSWL